MGLDLNVYGRDPDGEIDCVRIGESTDFDHFRQVVTQRLDKRLRRTRFPMLMRGDVWDLRWTTNEAKLLEQELNVIASELARLPHERQPGQWGISAEEERATEPSTLLESFVTIDAELFVLTFIRFTRIAQQENGHIRMS